MAEFPALNLWTDAFLSDTMHLDAAETGAYLLLLMAAWRRPNNDLPDDDQQLARFARMTAKQWTAHRFRVMAFWTLVDGCWRQKKLDSVRAATRKKSDKARVAANARWGNAELGHSRVPYSLGEEETRNRETPAEDANGLKSHDVSDADASKTKTKTNKEKDTSFGFVSLSRQTEHEAAQDRQRVLSNYDFMSDDGSVLILADEFAELEREITTIKSVRAIARSACRSWLMEIAPGERKQALLAFLRKKQRENLQRKASSSLKPDEATRAAFNEKLRERDAQAARVAAYREREAQRKMEKEANARQTEPNGGGEHLGPNGCN